MARIKIRKVEDNPHPVVDSYLGNQTDKYSLFRICKVILFFVSIIFPIKDDHSPHTV